MVSGTKIVKDFILAGGLLVVGVKESVLMIVFEEVQF